MSLTSNVKIQPAETYTDALETDQVEIPAIAGQAALLPLDETGSPVYALSADWAFTENAENPAGEVAVDGRDFDATDGLVYTGAAPTAVQVTVLVDTDAGAGISPIAPEATDSAALALFRNNDLVGYASEGYVAELDAEVVTEWNLDTYVNVQENDVLRLAFVNGTVGEAFDIEAVEAGSSVQIK